MMHNALSTIPTGLRQDLKGLQLEIGFACFEAVEVYNERDVECNICLRGKATKAFLLLSF